MKNKCHVRGCEQEAHVEVFLYDVYFGSLASPSVFVERDITCPFLCLEHMAENETKCEGTREPRGNMIYPYSNQHEATGFTIYRPLPHYYDPVFNDD